MNSLTDFQKRAVLLLLSVEEMELIASTMRSTMPHLTVAQDLADRLSRRIHNEKQNYDAQHRLDLCSTGKGSR